MYDHRTYQRNNPLLKRCLMSYSPTRQSSLQVVLSPQEDHVNALGRTSLYLFVHSFVHSFINSFIHSFHFISFENSFAFFFVVYSYLKTDQDYHSVAETVSCFNPKIIGLCYHVEHERIKTTT